MGESRHPKFSADVDRMGFSTVWANRGVPNLKKHRPKADVDRLGFSTVWANRGVPNFKKHRPKADVDRMGFNDSLVRSFKRQSRPKFLTTDSSEVLTMISLGTLDYNLRTTVYPSNMAR